LVSSVRQFKKYRDAFTFMLDPADEGITNLWKHLQILTPKTQTNMQEDDFFLQNGSWWPQSRDHGGTLQRQQAIFLNTSSIYMKRQITVSRTSPLNIRTSSHFVFFIHFLHFFRLFNSLYLLHFSWIHSSFIKVTTNLCQSRGLK
jgi:hypothetical protein